MRVLRNFKPDRCRRLVGRIADRAFLLADEERTRFVGRLWRAALGFPGGNFFISRDLTPLVAAGSIVALDAENLHSSRRKHRFADKGRRGIL